MKRLSLLVASVLSVAAATSALADDSQGKSSSQGQDSSSHSQSDGGPSQGKASSAAINGASATGTGTVVVFTPVTVTQTQGLNFGAIASGVAGTVAIDAVSGSRAVNGGVTAITSNVGEYGTFVVTGQYDAAINVVVGKTISGFAGGISGTTSTSPLPNAMKGLTASFTVGGVLNIPANSKAGVYSGTYQVAVNYP